MQTTNAFYRRLASYQSTLLSTIVIIDTRLCTFVLSRLLLATPINVIFIGQFI